LENHARHIAATRPSEVAEQPDGPAYYPPVRVDGIRIEELMDLAQVAKGEGISHAEAIDRYSWQTELQAVRDKLEVTFPDETSGVSLINDGRTARIGFKGKVPDLAIELARTLPAEVELIGDKGFSEKELRETLESRSPELSKVSAVASYQGQYDVNTGVIHFEIKPRESNQKRSEVLPEALLDAAANPRIRIETRINEELEVRPAADDPYLRGGGYLDSGAGATCTSGFNLIRSDGYNSTTSARHCWTIFNDQYWFYYNHPNYPGQRTTLAFTQNPTRNYDFSRLIQTGSVGLTFTRTFYAALNRPRYVTANGTSPVNGARACFYGKTSHPTDGAYSCGNITASNYTYQFEEISGTWYGGIRVKLDGNATVKGGDSGGPLWYGNTAWGITSGQGNTGTFVATDRINDSDGLGTSWNVWTCPTC